MGLLLVKVNLLQGSCNNSKTRSSPSRIESANATEVIRNNTQFISPKIPDLFIKTYSIDIQYKLYKITFVNSYVGITRDDK